MLKNVLYSYVVWIYICVVFNIKKSHLKGGGAGLEWLFCVLFFCFVFLFFLFFFETRIAAFCFSSEPCGHDKKKYKFMTLSIV